MTASSCCCTRQESYWSPNWGTSLLYLCTAECTFTCTSHCLTSRKQCHLMTCSLHRTERGSTLTIACSTSHACTSGHHNVAQAKGLGNVHTRYNTRQTAEGIENRAEDSAHIVWQQWSHADSNHTSGPESDDLALDVAAAPSYAGAVAKL